MYQELTYKCGHPLEDTLFLHLIISVYYTKVKLAHPAFLTCLLFKPTNENRYSWIIFL